VKNKKQSKKSNSILLGLLLLIAAFGLFYLNEQDEKGVIDLSSNGPKTREALERVNRHLQETNRKVFMQERQGYIEQKKTEERLKDIKPQEEFKVDRTDVAIPEYDRYSTYMNDIGQAPKEYTLPSDPKALIQEQLFQEQAQRRYTEEFKKEYARQFIENARAEGWDIKLDSSFRVISVKKIERRPSYNVFDGYQGGGQ
jgi:hypothetical protein